MKYEDSTGNAPFKTVAEYALSCLCLPVSNAVAERDFSYVTCVKIIQHNRMKLTVLDSIVRIRTKMYFNDRCCKDFTVTDRMTQSKCTRKAQTIMVMKILTLLKLCAIFDMENEH